MLTELTVCGTKGAPHRQSARGALATVIIDEIFAGYMVQWDTCLNVVRIAGPGLPPVDVCLELQRRLSEERTRRLELRGETVEIRAPVYGTAAGKDLVTHEPCRRA